MTDIRSTTIMLILATAGFVVTDIAAVAQPPGAGTPPGVAAQGGGRGRGGGLPGVTPEQTQAVAAMNAALSEQAAAVTSARAELATATFAPVKNVAGITAAVEKLRAAELALATKRAEEFGKLQSGPHKLNPEQVKALIAAGGNAGRGRGGRGGGM
jgi:Spy/CpxP family protein refolding chaperone